MDNKHIEKAGGRRQTHPTLRMDNKHIEKAGGRQLFLANMKRREAANKHEKAGGRQLFLQTRKGGRPPTFFLQT